MPLSPPAGERPYRCQTCERTFTLKHSLVRHQRIHLKPRGAEGPEAGEAAGPHAGVTAADDASEYGDSSFTPTSTYTPSENESEGGSGLGVGGRGEEGGEEDEEEGIIKTTGSKATSPRLLRKY